MIKWERKPSGNCPVQAEGHFLGYYFYFRSRWSTARMEFSLTEAGWENDLIHARYELWHTKPMEAGWLPNWFCYLLIYWGCLKFLFKRNKRKTI